MMKNNTVLKYDEFIKEGFMTRSLNRKKETEKRLEDITFFDKNKKYIDLFLEKNGVKSYKDLMETKQTQTQLEIKCGWTVEDFNLVMIIIGRLMYMCPHKKLTGKFACNLTTHWSGYDFDVTNRLYLTKISGQISKGTIDQIGWSDDLNGGRQFQHKLHGDLTNRKFTEDEYYEAFDFMIDNFVKVCGRYIEFDEYVKEGFMTRSLNRDSSGSTKRLENKTIIDDYIKTIEWVDLGHDDLLFAKFDYGYDRNNENNELLSINEIKNILSKLPKDISIMNNEICNWFRDNCTLLKEKGIKLTSKLNNYTTSINLIYNPDWYFIKDRGGYFLEIVDDNEDEIYGNVISELKLGERRGGKIIAHVRNNVIDSDKLDKPTHIIKLVKKK